MKYDSSKRAVSKPRTVGRSRLLDLPSELRSQIYASIFPHNTRFETSQRISNPDPSTPSRYARKDATLHHPVVIHGVEIKYLLGILGTCKKIRQEARSILSHNLRGTFTIEIEIKFRRIPRFILELIDAVLFSRSIMTSKRQQYFALFPNLKSVIKGTFVVSRKKLIEDWVGLQPSADAATCQSLIKAYFNSLSRHDLVGDHWAYTAALKIARKNNPGNWKLFSGECPVAIIVQMYVVDDRVCYPADPHTGLLVTIDYNHGRIASIEEKTFARLQDSEVLDPSQRVWFSSHAWIMMEQGKAKRPERLVSIANSEDFE